MKATYRVSTVLLAMLLPVYSAPPQSCKNETPYQLIKDDSDPKKYYICFDKIGKPIEKACPDFCEFNASTKSCTPTLGSGRLPVTSDCTADRQKLDSPSDNNDQVCKTFFECSKDNNGDFQVNQAEKCPSEKMFSTILNDCVPEDEWYCGKEGPDCDSAVYQDKRILDKYDCHSFYACIGNIRVKGVCPVGQVFDGTKGWCVIGKDCKIISPLSPTNPNIASICKGKSLKFVTDPNYCLGYYYCIDDKTPFWSTCANKEYFNDGVCTSIRPNTCKCEDINWNTSPIKVLVQHIEKNKFYVCEKDKAPAVRTCPKGTNFNVDIKSCS